MAPRAHVRDPLRDLAFTTGQALGLGVTASMLRGRHSTQIHQGVWRLTSTAPTLELSIRAAALTLPSCTPISHVTALQWLGIDVGRWPPMHFSTRSALQNKHDDIAVHRRDGRLSPRKVRGVTTWGPDRSFVDSATLLSVRDLVRAGDALVRAGLTTTGRLLEYVTASHLDGVVRAREAAVLVEERVDSFRETDVRLLMHAAHLPAPEVNIEVCDREGHWLARGDLVLQQWRVLVEYDGWHHERDAAHRQKDHLRRERLEAAGWAVVVVTVADLESPTTIVSRIFATLVRRGYAGPPPILGREWANVTRNW